jgi:hypothetical protein
MLYRDFILEQILNEKHKAWFFRKREGEYFEVVLGYAPSINVKVELLEVFSRSFKLKLSFDCYISELLFFAPTTQSPDQLMERFQNKLNEIVNETFYNNGREEEINEKFKNPFKNENQLVQNNRT